MMNDLTFSIIEVFISLVVESVILGGLFTYISNKTAKQNEQQLKDELSTVESQNKLIYQELCTHIETARNDIISQIKETGGKANES